MGSRGIGAVSSRGWLLAMFISLGCACASVRAAAPTTAALQIVRYPATAPASIRGIDKFARISDGLYRGAQPSADGISELRRMGIKTIVCLRAFHTDAKLLKGTGIQYVRIECNAWHPETEDVIAFLNVVRDPGNRPVFVHCAQGVDRTGMMVAAYRVVEQGWSTQDAVKELRDFGFHPIWGGIKDHIEHFNVEFFRDHLKTASAMKIERIN